MSHNNQLYFRMSLTENEHYIVEDMFQRKCNELGLKLQYYRKLKNGHVPGIREIKVTGLDLYRFDNYLLEEDFIRCSKEDMAAQELGYDDEESRLRFQRYSENSANIVS